MVDFAGWDMPVQYASIVDEHQAVRTNAGVFDISHMGRLWFEGPDAVDFVQLLYTNNAANLKEGQVRYGLICNAQGGIRDDVLVYRWPNGLGMVVNASNREKILAWIAEHKSGRKVTVRDDTFDTCMIAVQGPRALELCRGLTPADIEVLGYYFACRSTCHGKPCVISRTGYTGEDGFELIVAAEEGQRLWEMLVARGAKPCGLGARDTLRLEAAMPLYGHELNEEIDPFQAGLGWFVKMSKGDFIGKDALARRVEDTTRRERVGLGGEAGQGRLRRPGGPGPPQAGRVAAPARGPGAGRQAHRPRRLCGAGRSERRGERRPSGRRYRSDHQRHFRPHVAKKHRHGLPGPGTPDARHAGRSRHPRQIRAGHRGSTALLQ
jgi:aminomethyltransferase